MKRIVILVASLIFMVGISGKTRVYTANDHILMEIYSAYLALALLNAENHDLLLTLLNDPNERFVILSLLKPGDNLEKIKVSKKPISFSAEDSDYICSRVKEEFFKSDTIACFALYDGYGLIPKEDFDFLDCVHTVPFGSYSFQKAIQKSGAKTNDEKIQVLREWIDETMKSLRLMSTDPRKCL